MRIEERREYAESVKDLQKAVLKAV